jgi:hypothetical protein
MMRCPSLLLLLLLLYYLQQHPHRSARVVKLFKERASRLGATLERERK